MTAIQTNDGGLYKCTATSKVGSAEHAARYNVYGLPFVKPMDKAAVVAGETMIVTCPVAGYPIETIVWEKAGRTLPVNRRQQVFQNGTLIIENVQRQADQGAYNCIAKNSQGFSAKGSLDVQVMGKAQSSFTFFLYRGIKKESSSHSIKFRFHGQRLVQLFFSQKLKKNLFICSDVTGPLFSRLRFDSLLKRRVHRCAQKWIFRCAIRKIHLSVRRRRAPSMYGASEILT